MEIELVPELGVEIPPDMPYVDLRVRAEAACRSMELLQEHGMAMDAEGEESRESQEIAAALTTAYAADPEKTSKAVTHERAALLPPATLINIRSYLTEYGRAVVEQAIEVRHLVTNRLLEESQNPDPRIRIRALELLGKHSDVGLFTDRSEVTITHQTTDELRERLRKKLQKLISTSPEPVNQVQIGSDVIDVDAEMGLLEETPPANTPNTDVYVPEEGNDGATA